MERRDFLRLFIFSSAAYLMRSSTLTRAQRLLSVSPSGDVHDFSGQHAEAARQQQVLFDALAKNITQTKSQEELGQLWTEEAKTFTPQSTISGLEQFTVNGVTIANAQQEPVALSIDEFTKLVDISTCPKHMTLSTNTSLSNQTRALLLDHDVWNVRPVSTEALNIGFYGACQDGRLRSLKSELFPKDQYNFPVSSHVAEAIGILWYAVVGRFSYERYQDLAQRYENPFIFADSYYRQQIVPLHELGPVAQIAEQ